MYHRPTHDPSIDTFRIEYLLGPCVVLSLIFNYHFNLTEILWSFSIFLESVAILPQLFMLQRTGEAETITTHYLAALGAYRALYIPNWMYRCVSSPCGPCLGCTDTWRPSAFPADTSRTTSLTPSP
jgi:ER lumen protein retaining receptor